LERNLREEVIRIILTIERSEAEKTETTSDDYDTELTKMAGNSSEKGVNEIQSGDKNLDDEFKKSNKKVVRTQNTKSNKSKKSKKNKRKH